MALFHINFFSHTLGMMMQAEVVFPQGTPADAKIPTLYLLHGMSDDQSAWQRRTSIERYADEAGIAVVMPTTHLGWYTDMKAGLPYYTYIARELPAIMRDFFPKMSDRREDTYVAGLSMGGYGALKCALLDSDTFCSAGCFSGALDLAGRNPQTFGGVFKLAFGEFEDFCQSPSDNLMLAAKNLADSGKALPEIFIWCGTEDFLLAQNHTMRDHLQALGYAVTYSESSGNHSWPYWDEQVKHYIRWFMEKRK